ncbi:GNAT family N-acetyltransferase [Microbacterium saperdae]
MSSPAAQRADPAQASALTIRLVHEEEYDEAGRVTVDAYASSYGDLTEDYIASLRDVAGRVESGDVWVAVDSSETILGTVWVARPGAPLSPSAREGETDFRQLAVAPAARGRGVGVALTRHVIALATERGAQRVVMNSGPQMTGAHALYAKVGFRRLTEREHPVEIAPGRWIDLLSFGFDIPQQKSVQAPAATNSFSKQSDSSKSA